MELKKKKKGDWKEARGSEARRDGVTCPRSLLEPEELDLALESPAFCAAAARDGGGNKTSPLLSREEGGR